MHWAHSKVYLVHKERVGVVCAIGDANETSDKFTLSQEAVFNGVVLVVSSFAELKASRVGLSLVAQVPCHLVSIDLAKVSNATGILNIDAGQCGKVNTVGVLAALDIH